MKLLMVSDNGVSSGFGRIADEVCIRLAARGVDVFAASILYDGLLPPQANGRALPYWVASVAGQDWLDKVLRLIPVVKPDVVMVCQDAPYGVALRGAPVDWSLMKFVMCTPVDGVPIFPQWVDVMKLADAAMTISEFGVNAYRAAGVPVSLLRPGIHPEVFKRLTDEERADLRTRLGIAPDAFVIGSMAMNQGRKAYPAMLETFFRFAQDKPAARYLIDADRVSPAGWDIPAVCRQNGWDAGRLIFREDAMRAGLTDLNQRYNLLDVHMVLAHREGYGLPLVEAMATGAVSVALDYCSGTEICGDGRGVLVKPLPHQSIGTWGGARDAFPDIADAVAKLEHLYTNPAERAVMAQRGMTWARRQTWDEAADSVARVLEGVLK